MSVFSAWIRLALVACAFVASTASLADAEPARALELEGRLFAPCCWIQTLDIHESELATSLRSEIRTRLASGEGSQQIEDDLAKRFGERIRAVPAGRDPRGTIPLIVGLAMALAATALLALGVHWMRRRTDLAPHDAGSSNDDGYDAALDTELRNIDSN